MQLTTVALYDAGGVRTGTGVSITLRNLNGQTANDNTKWSGLRYLFFGNSTAAARPAESVSFDGPLSLSGGATGAASFIGRAFSSSSGQRIDIDAGTGLLGGCAASGPVASWVHIPTPTAFTCGTNAVASLSFASSGIYNALEFTEVIFFSWGQVDGSELFYEGVCDQRSSTPICHSDDLGITAPEPISVALIGTGLLGVGGAKLRRRRQRRASACAG